MTAMMTPTMKAPMKRAWRGPISSALMSSIKATTPAGKALTMPAKMISEVPLPMPDSVICSPSHMMNTVPVVRVKTVTM